ncbi:MAG: GatB/YqeY domain-containing protein [Actinobacteria bacterium]|nr:GatB/YqeY domain-containing protein [Actinomycetota bacterium]
MGLKERLRNDLTKAIRSRDKLASGTIRMVLTAITNEEVSGKSARELTDAEVITVLSREAKKRREAAEAFDAGGRPEKAALERSEGEVIAKYLPEQLTGEKLREMIAEAIAETGASGPAGMGLVMKVLAPKIAGKADGGTVSAAVKAALA